MINFDLISVGDYVLPNGSTVPVLVKGKCRNWKFSRTLTCDVVFSEDDKGNTMAYRMDELASHSPSYRFQYATLPGVKVARQPGPPPLQADDPVIVGVACGSTDAEVTTGDDLT